jgi:hypothetical protein
MRVSSPFRNVDGHPLGNQSALVEASERIRAGALIPDRVANSRRFY